MSFIFFSNLSELKTFLTEAWQQMDQGMCSKMVQSISRRLNAMIDKKEEKVFPQDCQQLFFFRDIQKFRKPQTFFCFVLLWF